MGCCLLCCFLFGCGYGYFFVSFECVVVLCLVGAPDAEARHKSKSHAGKNWQKHRIAFKRSASSRHSSRRQIARRFRPRYRPQQEIGALVMTEGGETVVDQLSTAEFNPASAVKIITAYGALSKFGPDYRFTTDLYLDGSLDSESGVFTGDLYLKGFDPDFEKKDAEELARGLADAGIHQIEGKLIVEPGFSYRSDPNPLSSAKSVARIMHGGRAGKVAVKKGVQIGIAPADAWSAGQFESETLRETLKRMMSYSLNRVAEQVGRTVGGVNQLEERVAQEAGLAPGSLKLASASGLGQSRVKPCDMMMILKGLRSKLQSYSMDYQDIFPVAGIDPGTLDERFTGKFERGSVVAKTGTLPGTDGGTSALVGMFRSQKEDLYFVIFCWKGSVVGFRGQQDAMIRQLQAKRGGPKAFEYYRKPAEQLGSF